MTVQEAKESIEYLKMQLTEDLEMICFTGDELKALDMSIQALEEIEQYRALGTVEELKKAREKQVAKKPIDNGMRSGIFATHKYYTCPRCGNVCLQKMANERQNTNYCWDCGQALKWGEEDEQG